MKKFLLITIILATSNIGVLADEEIDLIQHKGDTRTETTSKPKASYDDDCNTIILAIEADRYFEMKVIDISGTVVFTCPVIMVDGTPANYQLPELPTGIYTLKVESPEVAFEGTLVIE